MIEFEITDLYPGSVAQKNVGIFASFTLNLKTSDGIVVALHDMKLKKRKGKKKETLLSCLARKRKLAQARTSH